TTCLSLGSTHSYYTASHPLHHGPSSPNDDQSSFFRTVRRAGLGHILVRLIVPGSMPRAQGSISGDFNAIIAHCAPRHFRGSMGPGQTPIERTHTHCSLVPAASVQDDWAAQAGTRAGPLALSGQQTHAGLVVKRPGLVPDLGGTGQRPFGCLASHSTAPFRSPCRQCGPVLPRHRKPQTRVIDAWRPIFVMMRIDTEAPSRFLGSYLGLFMALTWGLRRATCRSGLSEAAEQVFFMTTVHADASWVDGRLVHNPSREFAVTEAIPLCRADAVSNAEDMMQFQHENSGLYHSHGL
ncbi:hypothetical protein BN1723_004376, partial [Verticillium longisporum]